MTKCYHTALSFPSVKRRKVEADFRGGDITSNGGIPFLSQVDQQLGLSHAAARALTDTRRQAIHNTRRIRLLMSHACPHQNLFRMVAWRLDSS